jgi:hypothetical protein
MATITATVIPGRGGALLGAYLPAGELSLPEVPPCIYSENGGRVPACDLYLMVADLLGVRYFLNGTIHVVSLVGSKESTAAFSALIGGSATDACKRMLGELAREARMLELQSLPQRWMATTLSCQAEVSADGTSLARLHRTVGKPPRFYTASDRPAVRVDAA